MAQPRTLDLYQPVPLRVAPTGLAPVERQFDAAGRGLYVSLIPERSEVGAKLPARSSRVREGVTGRSFLTS